MPTTVELVQELIRNKCVNDGSPGSGHEERSVSTLTDFFGVKGEVFEPIRGRQSVVYRVQGTDPDAPALALVPHLDVVPAASTGWTVDPFSAEIADGFIWGRGAIDMLNVTAAMAQVFKPYLTGEATMPGDLIFAAVADEENAGKLGAGPLVEDHWPLVEAEYLLTEVAYPAIAGKAGPLYPVAVGEKGIHWTKMETDGTPGHGSAPYGVDNALKPLSEAVHGLFATPAPVQITAEWQEFVAAIDLPDNLVAALVDPDRIDEAIDAVAVEEPTLARYIHAVTHLTVSPNIVRGGTKTNTVPEAAYAELDIRILPGMETEYVYEHLRRAAGAVASQISLSRIAGQPATISPRGNPLWDSIVSGIETHTGSRAVLPTMMTGATDARFWRAKGTIAYGVGLHDDAIGFGEFLSLFHGRDERVSIRSVDLTTELLATVLAGFATKTGA